MVPSSVGAPFLDPAVVQEIERHPHESGNSSWAPTNLLHALTLSLRPNVVLEIGAHLGAASVAIGSALRANQYGTLYCLEPADQSFKVLVEFVRKAGMSDYVRPLKLLSTSPQLGVIF